MVQTVQASDLTLHEVKEKFGLREAQNPDFFHEWQGTLPELTDEEKLSLDQVKANFLYLSEYQMSEEAVKLVVLSPLLSMAGFYGPPFHIRAEASVQLAAEDDGVIVRGRIDVLVLQDRLWVLVVEAKGKRFSLDDAIAQALFYMLSTPNPDRPAFGFATNGSEFIFLKSVQEPTVECALSDLFALRRRQNELHEVLGILKQISDRIKT